MKFNITNKEIQSYLESLEYLYHYSGNGKGLSAMFSVFNPEEGGIKSVEKCKTTGFPRWSSKHSFKTVDLDMESYATWSMPIMHLTIFEQREGLPYCFEVHFCHLRTGDDYDGVFFGYVNSVQDIKDVFRLLGINSKDYLR